ncbi:MAG: hypothetical protein ABW061_18235 [Polyangiaceae bacterium]
MRFRELVAGGAFVALSGFSGSARPCGAFVALAEKTVPSLSVEQTLIVYDAAQGLEHFVRQIAIRDHGDELVHAEGVLLVDLRHEAEHAFGEASRREIGLRVRH